MSETRRLLPDLATTSDPVSLERLKERGFDRAMARAWSMEPAAVIAEVKNSGIKGRGGAAFPTGVKWDGVHAAPGKIKYVVMNADESELGTFKDRALLEQDPLGALVGVLIAAHAVGAKKAYCYVRGEYREVEQRMADALATLEIGRAHV